MSIKEVQKFKPGRVIVLLLDSFGIGASSDAAQYGDVGADTLGHIARNCALGLADKPGVRQGPLALPNLFRRGLHLAAAQSTGSLPEGITVPAVVEGAYGYAQEQSHGKDTPSGHWEIAGVPVLFDWGYFPPDYPSFPQRLVDDFIAQGNLPGILGNRHASGTDIIKELGEEHLRTGKPIVYTSADSVFQIAAHETGFGLERLYALCQIARKLVDPYCIGRVIARPFLGEPGAFYRTGNRHDYSIPPPAPTLLDELVAAGHEVIAIGKTADIFAHRGISQTLLANGNRALFEATLAALAKAPAGSLIFTNFVDFDTLYGHRRDVIGYAAALEDFDRWLPELDSQLQAGDWVVVAADHGCDPTRPGTDHTREHIPVLVWGPGVPSTCLGGRHSFADIGQSIARHLAIPPLEKGEAFIDSNQQFIGRKP